MARARRDDRRRCRQLAGWLAASLLVLPPAAVSDEGTAVDDPTPGLSVERILGHLRALGSDAMEGRGTGTPGGERAAAYLETRMAEIGLEPLGDDGGYRQAVPMHGSLPLPESRLTLVDAGGEAHDLELWDDYVPFDTGAQTFQPVQIPLVFVAYGIVAPEYDHNDYQRVEVAGRIAVVLAGEPPSTDDDFFEGAQPTVYSDPEMKFRTALARGARGAILLPSPREVAFVRWDDVLGAFQTEDLDLPYGLTGNLNLLLRFERAPQLFAGARHSFTEVLDLDRRGALGSFPLESRASFTGVFRERDFLAHNLVGRLPGSDPLLRRNAVIVCAHYDHLGVGRPVDGDAIYNGVIDNASGTAVVLELARVLAAAPARPRRSIVFLFLTGEEKGLLGSRYYRDHPAVPLHRTVAAVNVDGISFIDRSGEFVGVGARFSTLGELLGETLASLGLRHGSIPGLFQELDPFYKSDQIAFAQAGIPAILVMEGFGYASGATGIRRFVEWGRNRYHTPFDDLEQPIDPEAVEQHATVLLAFVRRVADTFTEPRWLPGAPFLGARLRSLAEGT